MSSRTQLLTPSALRQDSRLPLELRSLTFTLLPSPPHLSPNSPDGYAQVTHGLTSVTSSVFGPREGVRTGAFSGGAGGQQQQQQQQQEGKGTVNVEVGVAGWSERNKEGSAGGVRKGGKDRRSIELAASLKATFEPVLLLHLFPRSSIDIYIQILEVDGSLLQASINATTLSLISAGLPLSDYICSLSLASYPSLPPSGPAQIPPFELISPAVPFANLTSANIVGGGGGSGTGCTTLLDLTAVEENSLPNLTVAVLPRSGKITLVGLESRVSVGRFEEMLRWGVEGAKVVQGGMEEAVRTWAESLNRPREGLENLFPGIGSGKGGKGGRGEEDMED